MSDAATRRVPMVEAEARRLDRLSCDEIDIPLPPVARTSRPPPPREAPFPLSRPRIISRPDARAESVVAEIEPLSTRSND